MIAVALINNTRLDNWLDQECLKNFFSDSYYHESVCDTRIQVLSSVREGSNRAQLEALPYNLEPIYDPNANKSILIADWKNAGGNVANHWYIATENGGFNAGSSIRQSIFSQYPGEIFARKQVNNVIARSLLTSEYASVTGFTGDKNFSPDWGVCVTWYKVAQPPEVIDKQNTFQLVLACMNSNPDNKCVTLFDYFELMYTENDGVFIRAGVTGPGLVTFELEGSNSAGVVNLVTDTNTGIPGLWLFELNQEGSCASLQTYKPIQTGSPYGAPVAGSSPIQCPTTLVTHAPTTTAVVPPEQTTTAVVPPEQTTTAVVPPEQTTTAVVPPEQTTTAVVPPEQTTTAVVPPEQTTTAVVPPEQTTTAVVPPEQTTTAVVPPEQTTTAVVPPEQTTETTSAGELLVETTQAVGNSSNASVTLTLARVTTNTANITVDDDQGSSKISNISAFCTSEDHPECSDLSPEVNQDASDPGWVSYSGLLSGVSYQITVNTTTYNGNPDTEVFASIVFCTLPELSQRQVELTVTGDWVFIALQNNASFDSGTALVYDKRNVLQKQRLFTPTDFPANLTVPSDFEGTIRVTISVGSVSNCSGNGGSVSSETVTLEYPEVTSNQNRLFSKLPCIFSAMVAVQLISKV
ncbi:uncharacterized protein LOC142350322 [Convolutriloba macropyga]|uniref:uncharacterized protein LOC142350322 n=1 Tax=Convolutriloba macropyga TaxID=536237 RepID=UPI003F51F9B0